MREPVPPPAATDAGKPHPRPLDSPPARPARARLPGWAAAGALLAAIALAYCNSLFVPFVFDDRPAIEENATIRTLWPLHSVLAPPPGEGVTVEGRPVLNLSLALNYALGGTAVAGYHAVNLLIHAGAALLLFGLLRRLLSHPPLAARFAAHATPLAFLIALIWGLHPLQTESVTYVIQRAESLVGLFLLGTLYAFVRGAESRRRRWLAASVALCLAGMGTKEIMVSAPLLVLVCDRAWFAGTFRRAWQLRRGYYLGLLGCWIVLAWLVAGSGTRGGTAGFGINVTPWQYSLTQYEAITRYLALSFWPHPLVFDYGAEWVDDARDALPFALLVLGLFGATLVALRRSPVLGFAGLWFFAILSPTSSIVPGNRQTLAEHRTYLPLAAVITLAVCGGHLACTLPRHRRIAFVAGLLAAPGYGLLTVRRNHDYGSEVALYADTAAKRPANGFARYNLGKVLAESGRHAVAVAEYEAALRLMGAVPGVHYNLANSLAALGRIAEARRHYEHALAIEPGYANAHFNLGNLLLRSGDRTGALPHFRAAIAHDARHVEARANLAGVLLELGELDEARRHFEAVLETNPHSIEARFGLGSLLLLQERWAEASREFETVVRLRPDLAVARERLELARSRAGR